MWVIAANCGSDETLIPWFLDSASSNYSRRKSIPDTLLEIYAVILNKILGTMSREAIESCNQNCDEKNDENNLMIQTNVLGARLGVNRAIFLFSIRN